MNAPVTDRRQWLGGILLALVVGVAAAGSTLLAVGLALAALVLYGYARSRVRAELVVGLYWITFDLYLSVFAGTDVPGLFYPFYAAFGVALVVVLVRAGWRADPAVLTLYLLFLAVVAASFLDFGERIDFGVTQRVLAYLFGGIVLFQIGSRRGLNTVATSALLGSSTA